MFQLTSKIVLKGEGGKEWRFKGSIETESISTWDALTDTCKLIVPKKEVWLKNSEGKSTPIALTETPLFRKGNGVSVGYGYDGRVNEWFNGYISNLYAGVTVAVNCQDAMYLLKQGGRAVSYRSVMLSQLLKDIIGDVVPYKVVADYDLGQFRTTNGSPTAAQIMETLRNDYFIRFFFRNGVLYAGLSIVPELQKEHKIKYIIDNRLEYVRKDDQKIRIKAVIMYPNNKSKVLEFGDPNGELRTVTQYNVSETDMKKLCEQKIEEYRYEGFRGSFTTFLEPNINHGDIVNLPNNINGLDRASEGKYIVRKVIKYFKGLEARQEIELERRIL